MKVKDFGFKYTLELFDGINIIKNLELHLPHSGFSINICCNIAVYQIDYQFPSINGHLFPHKYL